MLKVVIVLGAYPVSQHSGKKGPSIPQPWQGHLGPGIPQLLSDHSGSWNLREAVQGPFQLPCCSQAHGLILCLLEHAGMQEDFAGYLMLCSQSFIETSYSFIYILYVATVVLMAELNSVTESVGHANAKIFTL